MTLQRVSILRELGQANGGPDMGVFEFYSIVQAEIDLCPDNTHLRQGETLFIVLLDLFSGEVLEFYRIVITSVEALKGFDAVKFEAVVLTGECSGMNLTGFYGALYDLRLAKLWHAHPC